ncbi:MAG: plastocyanin [Nitrosopumilaceae archaeon]
MLSGGVISYSAGEFVPSWIKNTAKWYGEGIISDQEYLDSIKFLIENNIITIDKIKEKIIIEPIILTPEESFTDPRITMCNVLHPSYLSQEESQFQKQHSHINYIYDCVDLYEDKVWNYQGEDRLERIYNKFIEIHEHNIKLSSRAPIEPHTEVRSIVNVGTEKFLIKFDICADDALLDKAKVLVKSDIETILVGSDKDIQPNSCRNYETLIYSIHPENIEIEIIEKVLAQDE